MRELTEYGVLLEFIRMGNATKVCAIDQKSGTEVSIMGPSSASEADLREVVIRKLKYVMAKKS